MGPAQVGQTELDQVQSDNHCTQIEIFTGAPLDALPGRIQYSAQHLYKECTAVL